MGLIEDIIMTDGDVRRMDQCRVNLSDNYVENAVAELLTCPKKTVFLVTGFYVKGHGEMDGPLGTYMLAQVLRTIGYDPVVITDVYCRGYFDYIDVAEHMEPVRTIECPIEVVDVDHEVFYEDLLELEKPVAIISIERCGKNEEGHYRTMRHLIIDKYTAPIDVLFNKAKEQELVTIGIGDAGNEIGMGNLLSLIKSDFPDVKPSVVEVEHLLVATVSDWAAFAMMASICVQLETDVMPRSSLIKDVFEFMVSKGGHDGIYPDSTETISGYSIEQIQEIYDRLVQVVKKKTKNGNH